MPGEYSPKDFLPPKITIPERAPKKHISDQYDKIDITKTKKHDRELKDLWHHLKELLGPELEPFLDKVNIVFSGDPTSDGEALSFHRTILINTEKFKPGEPATDIVIVHEFFHIFLKDEISSQILNSEPGKRILNYYRQYLEGNYIPTQNVGSIAWSLGDYIKHKLYRLDERGRVLDPQYVQNFTTFIQSVLDDPKFIERIFSRTQKNIPEGDLALALMEVGTRLCLKGPGHAAIEEGLVTYLVSKKLNISIDQIREVLQTGPESEYLYDNAKIIEAEYGDDWKKVMDTIEKGKKDYDALKYLWPLFEKK